MYMGVLDVREFDARPFIAAARSSDGKEETNLDEDMGFFGRGMTAALSPDDLKIVWTGGKMRNAS